MLANLFTIDQRAISNDNVEGALGRRMPPARSVRCSLLDASVR
jgi:hypothetical protein